MSLTYETIYSDYMLWYTRHNREHRINAPSTLWIDGYLRWCQYGIQHNTNGPAVVWQDGRKRYFNRGKPSAKI